MSRSSLSSEVLATLVRRKKERVQLVDVVYLGLSPPVDGSPVTLRGAQADIEKERRTPMLGMEP